MFCVRAGSKTNKQRRKFISKQLKWKINYKYNIKQVKFVLIFVFLSAKKSTPQQLQALVLHMQEPIVTPQIHPPYLPRNEQRPIDAYFKIFVEF